MNVKIKLDTLPQITLKKGKDTNVRLGHHWVFSGAIEKISTQPKEGDLVRVSARDGALLGVGYYGEKSIAVRMLDTAEVSDLEQFYSKRLNTALSLRLGLNLISEDTDSYRLFHSEGDFLPGLTIDQYAKTLVIQAHHQGILNHLEIIKKILLEIIPNTKCIVLFDETKKGDNKNFIYGDTPSGEIVENGIKYKLDIFKGQKTGFFLDQRDNRFLLRSLAKDKSVLNLFSYSGGFSLNAIKGGAKEVISVDASVHALELLEENIKLNKFTAQHKSIKADCGEYLNSESRKFDIVIQDPPALVKKKQDLKKGLSYYKALTALSLNRVSSGGLLFSFSCSQFVTSEVLLIESLKAAKKDGLKLQVLKKLHQAPCHPINPCHGESEYLKGFLFRVG